VGGYIADGIAFLTLEQLIEDKGFVPERVAEGFCRGRIFGIGSTVRRFLANFQAGVPWYQSGPESAGNGALMRIAPMLVPHQKSGGTDIWVDTALSAMMTHNDRAFTSACVAFIAMLWELLDMTKPPVQEWWVERYVELARDFEGEAEYNSSWRSILRLSRSSVAIRSGESHLGGCRGTTSC
jgi:ADP-ribosylglycohydrolase